MKDNPVGLPNRTGLLSLKAIPSFRMGRRGMQRKPMNSISFLFLLLAIVATAVNIFLFAHYGVDGFRPSGLALRAILLLVAIVGIVMALRYRSYDAFKNPKQRLANWLRQWSFESDKFDAIHLEWAYQRMQARVMGRYLADKQAGKRCVILREPIMKDVAGKESVNPAFDGLVEGLDKKLEIVKVLEIGVLKKPEPLPEGEEEPVLTGLKDETWTAADLDELLADVGEFDLLISCVPLPADVVDKSGRFTMPSLAGRKLALLGGYSKEYDRALEDGAVVAAVTFKPNCRFDEKDIPEDDQKAFEKRYLLLEGGPRVEAPPELPPVPPTVE